MCGSNCETARALILLQNVHTDCGTHGTSYLLSAAAKWRDREAALSSPFCVDFRHELGYISTPPYAFMECGERVVFEKRT
jgi:hypothetical protein